MWAWTWKDASDIGLYTYMCVFWVFFIMAMEYIIDNLLFGFDTFKQLLYLRYISITYQNSYWKWVMCIVSKTKNDHFFIPLPSVNKHWNKETNPKHLDVNVTKQTFFLEVRGLRRIFILISYSFLHFDFKCIWNGNT